MIDGALLSQGAAELSLGGRVVAAAKAMGLAPLEPSLIKGRGAAEAEVAQNAAEDRRRERLSAEQDKLDIKAIRAGEKRLNDASVLVLVECLSATTVKALEDDQQTRDQALGALIKVAGELEALDRAERLLTLREVVRLAEEAAEAVNRPASGSGAPDAAWLQAFREQASRCPDDASMRNLWAQLLVAELDAPGSQSRRAMNILQLMSPRDATIFQKVCGFVVNGSFLVRPTPRFLGYDPWTRTQTGDGVGYLVRAGITNDDLFHLDGVGLLSSDDDIMMRVESFPSKSGSAWLLILPGEVLVAGHNPQCLKAIEVPAYPLTEAGRQIFKLGVFAPPLEFARDLAAFVAHSPCEKVAIHNYYTDAAGQIRFKTEEIIPKL